MLFIRQVPHVLIADFDHVPEFDVFLGERFRVKRSPPTVDVPAVHHPVVLLVDPTLVDDRRTELFKIGRPGFRTIERFAEELPVEHLGDDFIPGFVQLKTADGQLVAALLEHGESGGEHIDERQLPLLGNRFRGCGVELQVGVFFRSVR